jgi:hypothetical protein
MDSRLALLSTLAISTVLSGCASTVSGSTPKTPRPAHSQQSASDRAAPVATKPPEGYVPSFAACARIALPTAGIDDSAIQVGPDSWIQFVTTNQWTGPVGSSNTESYVVWAGATGNAAAPPGVPAVVVAVRTIGSDGCSTQTTEVGTYADRSAAGPLRITSVTGGIVYLRAPSGAPIALSLVTHRYTFVQPAG